MSESENSWVVIGVEGEWLCRERKMKVSKGQTDFSICRSLPKSLSCPPSRLLKFCPQDFFTLLKLPRAPESFCSCGVHMWIVLVLKLKQMSV